MIELCTNHTGKMEGINSISTSVCLNPGCQKNQKISGSICSHCYAEAMMKMYDALEAKLERNTKALTCEVIPESELPVITDKIFRFEAFGDLNNEIQLVNYINIVKKNPGTRFTLYSKRYRILIDYFKEHDVPENFTLVISSLFLNKPMDAVKFNASVGNKFKPGQLKVFTVYDYRYIDEHPELTINCGARLCAGCRLCYERNSVTYMSEILKSDRGKTDIVLNLREPERRDAIICDALKELSGF